MLTRPLMTLEAGLERGVNTHGLLAHSIWSRELKLTMPANSVDEGGRWEVTGARDEAGIDGSGPARPNPGDAAVDGAPATDEKDPRRRRSWLRAPGFLQERGRW